MEEIELKCPACGQKFKGLQELEESPIELLEKCPSCPKWNKGLLLLAVIVTIIISALLIVVMVNNFQTKIFIGVLGLLIDVWGGFLIATGWAEKILVDAACMGDDNVESFSFLPKQTKRIRWGLIFLIIGFLLQALSGILSGISTQ